MDLVLLPSSTSGKWADLPPEVQVTIIKDLDNNSRLALRTCSMQCFQLVEFVGFRNLDQLELNQRDDVWKIKIWPTLTSSPHQFEYRTLEELQIKLNSITISLNQISTIVVMEFDERLEWELENVHVHVLIIRKRSFIKFFLHFNPLSLHTIDITTDKNQRELYDLPQMLHAKRISIEESYTTDEQLSKLNANQIELGSAQKLTLLGIHQFIKKVVEKSNEFEHFTLQPSQCFSVNEVIAGFDTVERKVEGKQEIVIIKCSSCIQLKMQYHGDWFDGKIIKDNDEQMANFVTNRYRIIDKLDFFFHCCCSKEGNESTQKEFKSNDEVQQYLDILFDGVIYIKKFKVSKISVGELIIVGDNAEDETFLKFLKSFEAKTLKSLFVVNQQLKSEEIFGTEQVKLAEEISFDCKCRIQNEQLLQLNANTIFLNSPLITATGLNMLIKKWIMEMKNKDRSVRIQKMYNPESKDREAILSELVEGLDIDSERCNEYGNTFIIVNTRVHDLQFVIDVCGNGMNGQMIERDQQFRDWAGGWIR